MKVIGLTGGVGTGKSTVAGMFRTLGAAVLDADRIAHALMRPGTAVWRQIRKRFGKGICSPSGRVDRKRLGALVFSDARRLKALTALVHPAVRRQVRERLRRLRRSGRFKGVVLDVPLLLESGSCAYRWDVLVVVSAPQRVVLARLRARSGWGPAQVRARAARQWPLREKRKRADFVIQNGGSLASTRRQVTQVWKQVIAQRKGENHHGR